MTAPAPVVQSLVFFVPCELKNYANHGGHWTGKAGYQKRLRDKTQVLAWSAITDHRAWFSLHPEAEMSVTLEAYVWNYFDTHDGLRNACKPLVDGLVKAKVIHSDAHDCGHQFLYTQILDRKKRGVRITVEPR